VPRDRDSWVRLVSREVGRGEQRRRARPIASRLRTPNRAAPGRRPKSQARSGSPKRVPARKWASRSDQAGSGFRRIRADRSQFQPRRRSASRRGRPGTTSIRLSGPSFSSASGQDATTTARGEGDGSGFGGKFAANDLEQRRFTVPCGRPDRRGGSGNKRAEQWYDQKAVRDATEVSVDGKHCAGWSQQPRRNAPLMGEWQLPSLEHDRGKVEPVFRRDSCSNNKRERR